MIRIHEQFFSREAAKRFAQKLRAEFPQNTYGLVLSGPRPCRNDHNIWEITGHRFA